MAIAYPKLVCVYVQVINLRTKQLENRRRHELKKNTSRVFPFTGNELSISLKLRNLGKANEKHEPTS